MSFFNKLKNRMFKSSSKLEQGLDEIIEDGGQEELVDDAVVTAVVDAVAIADAPAVSPSVPEAEVDVAVPVEPAVVSEPVVEPEVIDETPKAEIETPSIEPSAPIEPQPKAEPEPQSEIAPEPEAKKSGLIGRLLGRKGTPKTEEKPASKAEKKTVVKRALDDDMLERIEELLITADMGVDTALRVTANMAEGRFGKKMSTAEIKHLLAAEITRIMEPVAKPLPIYAKKTPSGAGGRGQWLWQNHHHRQIGQPV